jgi:hypothetical protein
VAGIAGAVTNDSGPLLMVVAVFVLACVSAYIQGDPKLADNRAKPPEGGTVLSEVAEPSGRPPREPEPASVP